VGRERSSPDASLLAGPKNNIWRSPPKRAHTPRTAINLEGPIRLRSRIRGFHGKSSHLSRRLVALARRSVCMAYFSLPSLSALLVAGAALALCGCSDSTEAPDASVDAGIDLRVLYVPTYACTSDDHCGGDLRCIDGACECEVNAQCNPFGMLSGACFEGRCVAMCPYFGAPRELPGWAEGCGGVQHTACCEAGERCCPLVFEVPQCLPDDRPCWPSCPGFLTGRACPPDQLCRGAEVSTGLAPRCSEVAPDNTGIDGRFDCVALVDCPAAQRCGAQTCCAPGTVCLLEGGGGEPIAPDGDPGFGRDLSWLARPAGACCIPD